MPINNVLCNHCGAWCQDTTTQTFVILKQNHSALALFGFDSLVITICELCLWPVDEPIPFIVTETGKAASIEQAKGGDHA